MTAPLSTVIFVTGTDTDVGKTLTTAALAASLTAGGATVAVYKPAQTGVGPGDGGDTGEVRRLSGTTAVFEGIRLRDPMSPAAAAAREGAVLPTLEVHAARIRILAADYDHVLVEGAGGLLVELDAGGGTIADLAALFPGRSSTLVVCRSGLGTLNHTQLTLAALRGRGLAVAGLVVGSRPAEPSVIELSNFAYFEALDVPLLGYLPERASALAPSDFQRVAPGWLTGL
ncbi:dethiobiotin synthase [Arthrobacter sp. H14-L1]|uniref:dethiobiotin synthase n=1 Tax=Arthrobacter sp. H14-L1 TaxID=2996697 RepID=UPI00227203E0|nr:dethiobiotin synthase [Arthrobacter sp. H14-L1]MCY0903351.1 dethiobiotin synthase [Arthrobacter sp. H14-L1]